MARDALKELLVSSQQRAAQQIETWMASDIAILRRLALFGWATRTDSSPDAKLSWLLTSDAMFDIELRNEVFALLAESLPEATTKIVDAVVAAAADAFGDIDNPRSRDYERFNLLTWIVRHSAKSESALRVLATILTDHPDFRERDRPDLLRWVTGGAFRESPGIPANELLEALVNDPEQALERLRTLSYSSNPMSGPTRSGTVDELRKVIATRYELGHRVIRLTDEADIVGAVISGWGACRFDDSGAQEVIDSLNLLELPRFAREIASLLGSQSGAEDRTEWGSFPGARTLAHKVWSEVPQASFEPTHDWLMAAVNEPAGWIAQFWINALADEMRRAGEDWTGLNSELTAALNSLLTSGGLRTAMAEAVLGARSRLLAAADGKWFVDSLLPLFSWQAEDRASRVWDAYLTGDWWSQFLLDVGMAEQYVLAASNLGLMSEQARNRYFEHTATLACFGGEDPSAWVKRLVRTLDSHGRINWARAIGWTLEDLDSSQLEAQWSRWIGAYWRDRLDALPVPLTVEEWSAMAGWIVNLGPSLDSATALLLQSPAGLPHDSNLLRRLTAERLEFAPTAYGQMLAHLLSHTDRPFHEHREVERIAKRVKGSVDVTVFDRLVEGAMRLGNASASDW